MSRISFRDTSPTSPFVDILSKSSTPANTPAWGPSFEFEGNSSKIRHDIPYSREHGYSPTPPPSPTSRKANLKYTKNMPTAVRDTLLPHSGPNNTPHAENSTPHNTLNRSHYGSTYRTNVPKQEFRDTEYSPFINILNKTVNIRTEMPSAPHIRYLTNINEPRANAPPNSPDGELLSLLQGMSIKDEKTRAQNNEKLDFLDILSEEPLEKLPKLDSGIKPPAKYKLQTVTSRFGKIESGADFIINCISVFESISDDISSVTFSLPGDVEMYSSLVRNVVFELFSGSPHSISMSFMVPSQKEADPDLFESDPKTTVQFAPENRFGLFKEDVIAQSSILECLTNIFDTSNNGHSKQDSLYASSSRISNFFVYQAVMDGLKSAFREAGDGQFMHKGALIGLMARWATALATLSESEYNEYYSSYLLRTSRNSEYIREREMNNPLTNREKLLAESLKINDREHEELKGVFEKVFVRIRDYYLQVLEVWAEAVSQTTKNYSAGQTLYLIRTTTVMRNASREYYTPLGDNVRDDHTGKCLTTMLKIQSVMINGITKVYAVKNWLDTCTSLDSTIPKITKNICNMALGLGYELCMQGKMAWLLNVMGVGASVTLRNQVFMLAGVAAVAIFCPGSMVTLACVIETITESTGYFLKDEHLVNRNIGELDSIFFALQNMQIDLLGCVGTFFHKSKYEPQEPSLTESYSSFDAKKFVRYFWENYSFMGNISSNHSILDEILREFAGKMELEIRDKAIFAELFFADTYIKNFSDRAKNEISEAHNGITMMSHSIQGTLSVLRYLLEKIRLIIFPRTHDKKLMDVLTDKVRYKDTETTFPWIPSKTRKNLFNAPDYMQVISLLISGDHSVKEDVRMDRTHFLTLSYTPLPKFSQHADEALATLLFFYVKSMITCVVLYLFSVSNGAEKNDQKSARMSLWRDKLSSVLKIFVEEEKNNIFVQNLYHVIGSFDWTLSDLSSLDAIRKSQVDLILKEYDYESVISVKYDWISKEYQVDANAKTLAKMIYELESGSVETDEIKEIQRAVISQFEAIVAAIASDILFFSYIARIEDSQVPSLKGSIFIVKNRLSPYDITANVSSFTWTNATRAMASDNVEDMLRLANEKVYNRTMLQHYLNIVMPFDFDFEQLPIEQYQQLLALHDKSNQNKKQASSVNEDDTEEAIGGVEMRDIIRPSSSNIKTEKMALGWEDVDTYW